MEQTPSESAKLPLDYGPRPKRKIRYLVRGILLGVAVCAIGLGVRWGPHVRDRLAFLSAQRQCMNYLCPAEEEPAEYWPACLKRWNPVFFSYCAGDGYRPDERVYFLHQLKTPSGQTRIVLVCGSFSEQRLWTDPPEMAPIRRFSLSIEMWKLGSWSTKLNINSDSQSVGFELGRAHRVRVFNGQPDPQDATSFRIRYELDGKSGHIVGWLKDRQPTGDDGSHLFTIRVVDGPAKELN